MVCETELTTVNNFCVLQTTSSLIRTHFFSHHGLKLSYDKKNTTELARIEKQKQEDWKKGSLRGFKTGDSD